MINNRNQKQAPKVRNKRYYLKNRTMKLIKQIKSHSSKWVKQFQNFYWKKGYGAFSVNPTEIGTVEEYIKSRITSQKNVI